MIYTPNITIIQDTREQCPLPLNRFPVVIATLPVGDYGVKGFSDWDNPQFIIERKSLDDLAGSLGNGRDRFMHEIMKMRQFRFHALVIESTEKQVYPHQYRSKLSPESIFGSLDALIVRTGLHVFWCGNPTGAAEKVESLAEKFANGILKDAKKLK